MSTASKPATAAFAPITGASSGIGAIYADRLAKRGRSVAPLFRPFVLSKLSLANRVVMAPMTRQKSPGGIPGPEVAAYYRRRAESGTGLIITEGTVVDDPVSTMSVDIPNFYGPALDGWLRVVGAVHEAGGKIMPQLWHVGMARNPAKAPHPELPSAGPSGLTMRGFPGMTRPGLEHSEPMTHEHIRRVVDAFARGAADARRLGFDGVEIHGAHGYLIDQFFWAGTNQRADEYGGDLVGRTRFAVEIIEAVRRATGPDFPIILRFSQWKQQDYAARLATTPEELARFLAPLSTAGVDIFHCSQRRFWEPEFEGSDLNLAGWTKKLTGKPTVTVGSVALSGDALGSLRGESSSATGIDDLLDRLERDEFDLVAIGRALLVDPAWTRKVQEARYDELLPFEPAALATLS
jgi:2,4-dienoyl-CoA reductase-like NADH-dependent reductase (Old Yellow Enzyme family)